MFSPNWHGVTDEEPGLRIAAARKKFLDVGEIDIAKDVPGAVSASWQRSQSAGVDANRYSVPFHEDIDFDSRLAYLSRPVIERLKIDMDGVRLCIALSDSRSRVIQRHDLSAAVGRILDRVDFNPGFSFEEHGVGTNGIGSVFESGAAVRVVGSAHFSEALVSFACIGAPIIDPATNRIEGVLDVSLRAEDWNPLIDALVNAAAIEIGRNMLSERSRTLQALFDAYLKIDTRSKGAVIAMGGTVMANARAQRMLSPQESLTVQAHAKFMLEGRDISSDILRLPCGRQFYIRARRVSVGNEQAGIVILPSELSCEPNAEISPSPLVGEGPPRRLHKYGENRLVPRRPSLLGRGQCPAWEQAVEDTHNAVTDGSAPVLLGEVGSGRTTLLREVFLHLWPAGRHRTIDAVDLSAGDRIDAAELRVDGVPNLVILRGIDRLTSDGLDVVEAFLAGAESGPGLNNAVGALGDGPLLVAATMNSQAAKKVRLDRVLRYFDHSISVPALRHRIIDLPQLVSRLLAEIAPTRSVSVSADALRVLSSHSWPRNVAQLREALEHAVDQRPVGEIQVKNLPGWCHSGTKRQLSAVEIAERDAIVVALDRCNGNRVQAALAVGMSRSSLYRKLRTYAIQDL